MALNLGGEDINIIGGGGGPSPSDPIQDAKISDVEKKTQNINLTTTDGTQTEFINKIIASEMSTPLSTAIKFRSSQYYDNGGTSGFFMGVGPNGTIQMNKTTYQGTVDAIMTLSANGTIQKTTAATCDASGNITTSGNIQAAIISATSQLSTVTITNLDATPTTAITIAPTTGIITFHKDILPSAGNILNLGSNTANTRFKDIYIDGDVFVAGDAFGLSSKIQDGQTLTTAIQNDLNVQKGRITQNETDITALQQYASPTEFGYNLTFSDLLGSGALRDEWFSTSTSSKVFINKISTETVADLFITYTRTNPSLTEIKLDGTTTGTTTTQKYVDFRDSGGLPNDYQPNELYNITFDAGVGNTWEMKTITCGFEHSGSGIMYDRLGLQESNDGVTYTNVSLSNFYQSSTTTPPWSTTRTSTTDGYIFPVDQTNIANVTYNINSRFVKFYFTSDGSSNRIGWDVRMTASDAFHGSLLIKDVNTYPNTKYVIKGGGYAQNSGNDLEIKYESSSTSPLNLNFSGSIPLVNFTLPSVGWTETSRNNSQLSLSGDLSVSSLLVNGQPVTSGLSGITSQDNGGGDIEISFTGSDYKTNGYLTVDTNGRIQVQSSLIVSNAEYDAIALKWTQERSVTTQQLVKIYLPQGVPVGNFDHTIHNVYILSQDPTNNNRQYWDVRFIGYQGSSSIVQLPLTNIFNATEIYNGTSQGHPNNVQPSDEKQHIINHLISDYNHFYFPNFSLTSITSIAVQTQDVGSWDHTKPFYALYSGGTNSFIFTLYGSQSGFTGTQSPSNPPPGYTFI